MRNGAVINGRDDVHIDILYIFISACYNFSIVGWLPLRAPAGTLVVHNATHEPGIATCTTSSIHIF